MRRRLPRVPAGMFGSEAELCERMMTVAREACHVHPETADWDVLLVQPSTGMQVGVQAKLRANLEVLAQALPRGNGSKEVGPDVRAVLVPTAAWPFVSIAGRLGVHVFQGDLISTDEIRAAFRTGHRWPYSSREWVPEHEVIAPAGTAAPKRVTKWKLSAVKLCLVVRSRGYATPADFRELKLDDKWWFDRRFGPVLLSESRGRYVLNAAADAKAPDRRWPEIAEAITREHRRVIEVEAPLDRGFAGRPRVRVCR